MTNRIPLGTGIDILFSSCPFCEKNMSITFHKGFELEAKRGFLRQHVDFCGKKIRPNGSDIGDIEEVLSKKETTERTE